MATSLCGVDCSICDFKDGCSGCANTGGKPFGKECMIARCCIKKGCMHFGNSEKPTCTLKEKFIDEFNALGIADMPKVTCLYALKGSFVNLEYKLPSGQTVKLLDDDKIYLGSQICKDGEERCYGLIADENIILVSEYGVNGADAEIIIYKKRSI